MRALILLFLAGCAAIDLLDGDIENPDTCCLYLGHERIASCVFDLVEPGDCAAWSCPTDEDFVCRDWDGSRWVVPEQFQNIGKPDN